MTEIEAALNSLEAELIDHDTAVRCLEILSEHGFIITRTQALLDQFVTAAMNARSSK